MPPSLSHLRRLLILIATMATASHANGLIKLTLDLRTTCSELKSFWQIHEVAEHRQACRSISSSLLQASLQRCGTLFDRKYGPLQRSTFARSNHSEPVFRLVPKNGWPPCPSAKYHITPEEEEERTGMTMTNPKCLNPGTDTSCPPDLGNTRVAPCTVWPMEKFTRTPDMDAYQSFDGPDGAYPDGLITDETLAN